MKKLLALCMMVGLALSLGCAGATDTGEGVTEDRRQQFEQEQMEAYMGAEAANVDGGESGADSVPNATEATGAAAAEGGDAPAEGQ